MKNWGFMAMLVLIALVLFAGLAQAATVFAGNPAAHGLLVTAGLFALVVGMALAADAIRDFQTGDLADLPVKASTKIYEGAAVGDTAGYMRGLVSGDPFRGFALSQADNSATATDGYIKVQVRQRGKIKLTVTGVAGTDIGRPVYATDDTTFVLTGIGSYIGRVAEYLTTNTAIVEFDVGKQEEIEYVTIPITNTKIADADLLTTFTPGFFGRVLGYHYVVHDPVTTGSKLSTLNMEIGTTNLTGGTLALTSATMTPMGKVLTAVAITAGAAFGPTDTISVEASSTTAFIEGTGSLVIKLGK